MCVTDDSIGPLLCMLLYAHTPLLSVICPSILFLISSSFED